MQPSVMCRVAPAFLAKRFISSARERPICAPRNSASIPNLLDPESLTGQTHSVWRIPHDLCRGSYPLHHAVPVWGRTPTVAKPAGLPPTRATGQSRSRICSSRRYLQTDQQHVSRRSSCRRCTLPMMDYSKTVHNTNQNGPRWATEHVSVESAYSSRFCAVTVTGISCPPL